MFQQRHCTLLGCVCTFALHNTESKIIYLSTLRADKMNKYMEEKKNYNMSYCNVPLVNTPKYQTIPDCIRHWADVQPDKEAVVFLSISEKRTSVTCKEVFENSMNFAKALREIGIEKHEIVGMNLPNSPQFLYAMFGTMMAGAIPISLSFTYSDGRDVIAMMNKLEKCKMFILDPGDNDKNWRVFKHVINTVDPDGSVHSTLSPSLKRLIFTKHPQDIDSGLDLSVLISDARTNTNLPVLDPEDIAFLFQTSGSTGMPKVVAHTHYSLMYAMAMGPIEEDGRNITYNERQFGWGGGFPFNFLRGGNTLVTRSLQSENALDGTKFVVEAVQQEQCTSVFALPPVVRELIQRKEEGGFDLKVANITTGGQPLVKSYASCLESLCYRFTCVYGSTESWGASICSVANPDDFQDYLCGQVKQGAEIKFVDENGHIVPVNTTGELWVRGPQVFLGYYNDEEKTKTVKTKTGWYKTDDIGYMTEKGMVFIQGRKSDMIISGGLNVEPSILESLLGGIQGVKNACIVPVPHPTLFQVICACLVKAEGSRLTDKDVREYVERIHVDKPRANTVVPAYYLFFKSFPQTSTGKISRKVLAAEAAKIVHS